MTREKWIDFAGVVLKAALYAALAYFGVRQAVPTEVLVKTADGAPAFTAQAVR